MSPTATGRPMVHTAHMRTGSGSEMSAAGTAETAAGTTGAAEAPSRTTGTARTTAEAAGTTTKTTAASTAAMSTRTRHKTHLHILFSLLYHTQLWNTN